MKIPAVAVLFSVVIAFSCSSMKRDYCTTVFAQGDDGCNYYRIPAMALDHEGNIVIAADRRYETWKDLGFRPTSIDVTVSRSTDGGRTWSPQNIIARGDTASVRSFGFGDPALLRSGDGKLFCLMACGKEPCWKAMRHVAVCESADGGVTWTAPRFIPLPEPGYTGGFVTSGCGLTAPDGTMLAAISLYPEKGIPGMRMSAGNAEVHLIYSEDGGENWKVSPSTAYLGGNESKLVLLRNGSLMISSRTRNGVRGFNTAARSADGSWEWGRQWVSGTLRPNACNADIIRFNDKVLLHSYVRDLKTRQDLSLAASTDEGHTWFDILTIQPEASAYSTMVLLPGGDLGILYEDGSKSTDDGYDLVFRRISARTVKKALAAQRR
jgi:sialidase-1